MRISPLVLPCQHQDPLPGQGRLQACQKYTLSARQSLPLPWLRYLELNLVLGSSLADDPHFQLAFPHVLLHPLFLLAPGELKELLLLTLPALAVLPAFQFLLFLLLHVARLLHRQLRKGYYQSF